MSQETINQIYRADETHDWAIIETDQNYYELRLGGIKKIELSDKPTHAIDLPFHGEKIKRFLTDDFDVLIELQSGNWIQHSNSWIDGDGNTSFVIYFYTAEEFKKELSGWEVGLDDFKSIS